MSNVITIHYIFSLENNKKFDFPVEIDKNTSFNKIPHKGTYPSWVDLSENKCSHCPLNEKDSPKCPLAQNIYDVIDTFKDVKSYEVAKIEITTKQRAYSKTGGIQSGLTSLLGLIMATSRCPYFNFLRPMAMHHVPFASSEETIIRVISTAFLTKVFQNVDVIKVSKLLDEVNENYKNIKIVNKCMLERISIIVKGDADNNAFVNLNIFAQMFEVQMKANLKSIAPIFKNSNS